MNNTLDYNLPYAKKKEDLSKGVDEVVVLPWKHLLGFHLPILLLWIAMWLSIINFIMNKF